MDILLACFSAGRLLRYESWQAGRGCSASSFQLWLWGFEENRRWVGTTARYIYDIKGRFFPSDRRSSIFPSLHALAELIRPWDCLFSRCAAAEGLAASNKRVNSLGKQHQFHPGQLQPGSKNRHDRRAKSADGDRNLGRPGTGSGTAHSIFAKAACAKELKLGATIPVV